MLRFALTIAALVCLSDVASACDGAAARRTPVRTALSVLRPVNRPALVRVVEVPVLRARVREIRYQPTVRPFVGYDSPGWRVPWKK